MLQVVALTMTAHAAAEPPQLVGSTSEPRAFGYRIGDVIERSMTVHAGSGLTLEEASVPRPGALGGALELRGVARRSSAESGGQRHALTLRYQLLLSPREPRILELPGFTLRFAGAERAQEFRVEAWPVTASPLGLPDASPRRGLGELRPDAAVPLINTTVGRTRLLVEGIVLLLLLAYLAHVYVGLPWWTRRHRPFTGAWRELRGITATSSQAQRQRAYRTLHDALNRTAGEVLFESGIGRFVAAHPRFAPLRADLVTFFRKSRLEHFSDAAQPDADAAWLAQWCRRCRDAERGAA